MLSVWQQQSFVQPVDIIIVGAGLTGLLSAIKLKISRPKLAVRILERGIWPDGASIKNAGFACYGSISEILDDINREGEASAFERVLRRWRGLKELITFAGERNIDLKRNGGFEIFTEEEEALHQLCLEALPEINEVLHGEMGFKPYSIKHTDHGMNILPSMISIEQEASLHSGKLMRRLMSEALNRGVEISFGNEVKEFHRTSDLWKVHCNGRTYQSRQLAFATNGFTPSIIKEDEIIPARGQILLTGPLKNRKIRGNYHLHQGYYYFRSFEDGILLGGGRHLDRENEATDSQESSDTIQKALEGLIHKTIAPGQQIEIRQRWAGTMAFGPSNEKDPVVKKSDEGYYLAARLGGMGVAISPIVAGELSEMIVRDI